MEEMQRTFLQSIQKNLKKDTLFVRELMEVLNISKSEAYNKIKGRSLLTTSQIQTLCNRFQVNFTICGNQQQQVSEISFMPFADGEKGVEDYIAGLEMLLQSVAAAKDKKLSCATDDIPFFHLFNYPELTAFKLHFWQMRSIENAPFVFSFSDWSDELLAKTKFLHDLYLTIPSVEVWTKSSLLNTLEQIKYAKASGIILDNTLGKLLCRQLRSAIGDIERFAINKSKTADGKTLFDWYFYEIIGSITYLAEMDNDLAAFIRFNTFNNIQAFNQPVCEEVKHWMRKLVADSTGFSGQGSVHRNKYLAMAYESCDEMERIFMRENDEG